MILITAAAGNLARELLPRLAQADLPVRGLRASRGGEQALHDLGAAEVVIGDIRDSDVIGRAVEAVDAVFHVCPGGLAFWERDIGFELIDAAIKAGVGHVVVSTVLHPIITGLLQHETRRDVEERLVSSPLDWTILQPADYMQTLVPPSTFSSGELPVARGERRRHSAVDLADVAEAAVKVLTEGERHFHARYELCGLPSSFDGRELAAAVARVARRAISVKPVSVREFMRLWALEDGPPIGSAHGLDDNPAARDFARQVLAGISEWYGEHDFVGNPNVLSWLLGRQPTSLDEYVERLHARVAA